MKRVFALIFAFFSLPCCLVAFGSQLPAVRLAADGFPAGHETPEGIAADLTRAFINHDEQQFLDSCLQPFGGGASREEYEAFLDETAQAMKKRGTSAPASPAETAKISKVYSARHFSRSGPSSYAYAAFDFADVMFVDVVVELPDGSESLSRTLVAKLGSGSWYAHPIPGISPLLGATLGDESASSETFSEKYAVPR